MESAKILCLFSCLLLLGPAAHSYSAAGFKNGSSTKGDPELEKYLREAIENFRKQMPVGIPEINMPVLDPLKLQDMDIQVNENVATMSLKLKEMTIHDLSQFTIRKLVPDLEKLYIKTSLSLPFITADGKYKIDGKLLKILPLYGEGNFQINLTNAQISGKGELGPVNDVIKMKTMKLDLWWTDLTIYLENFLGGGRFSTVLQKLLPKIGKGVFEKFKPEIMRLIDDALMKLINIELEKPDVRSIIDGLIPRE